MGNHAACNVYGVILPDLCLYEALMSGPVSPAAVTWNAKTNSPLAKNGESIKRSSDKNVVF